MVRGGGGLLFQERTRSPAVAEKADRTTHGTQLQSVVWHSHAGGLLTIGFRTWKFLVVLFLCNLSFADRTVAAQ